MKKRLLIYVMAISVVFLMSGCKQGSHQKRHISVSIMPLKYFVDRLTDKSVHVNVMLPSGTDHETYSPTPRQLKKLSNSRLYVKIGYLGYEQAWAHLLEELNPEMQILNLSNGIELIHSESVKHGDHSHEGGIDPHIWMSPRTMKKLVPKIRDAIIANFPELKEKVEKNYIDLDNELELLHLRYALLMHATHKKKFIIFHPALTYLAKDYELEQISIEFEGKEPTPARLAEIIKRSKQENINLIFVQAEYDVSNAEQIAKETGAKIIQINPMEYNWMDLMEELRKPFQFPR